MVHRTVFIAACSLLLTGNAFAQHVVGGCPIFPANNIWNQPIDTLPVRSDSATLINTIGPSRGLHPDFGAGLWEGGPMGIPFITVPGSQTKYPVSFDYPAESDPGPYAIPLNAPIEGGSNSTGDRHAIALDTTNCILYELYYAFPGGGSWTAGSGAIFDLKSNALRPNEWTSADAAGLPIMPGLITYDEILAGEIKHVIRFTVPQTRRETVWPARHVASNLTGAQYPRMGERFRLKASFDVSPFPPEVQIILRAMKKYGLIVSDNGSAWYVQGAPDDRWNNDNLARLGAVTGSNFEAVDATSLMVDPNSGATNRSSVVTEPMMSVDSPQSGSTVSQPFVMGGWAIDRAAASTSGIDAVHVYVQPAGGSPTFLGVAQYGVARGDVGSAYGARFTNSGFNIAVNGLAPGTYTLTAYAHSTVTNSFNNSKSVSITVAGVVSRPMLNVDAPGNGATVTQPFVVGGWALDRGATSGSGVSAVHVYAYPNPGSGAAPIFLGAASYGGSRGDVASIFGAPYMNSGYNLTVSGLSPGRYRIALYALSTVTGTFNSSAGVDITVAGQTTNPAMSIDGPPGGSHQRSSFVLGGWAVDLGASSGTGIDSVHVWAYPVGGAPFFIGVATYGGVRSDIGGYYGSRFTNSGYGIVVPALPNGTYDLVVFARSTVTGTFSQARVVRVLTP